jgi:hypothetical protein
MCAWARFLSYLHHDGDLDVSESPDQRLTYDRLGRFVLSMRCRMSDNSTHVAIADLSQAIAAMAPGQDWSWVRRHLDPTNPDVASAALAHRGRGTANLSYDKSGTAASRAVWTRVLERRLRTPRPRS